MLSQQAIFAVVYLTSKIRENGNLRFVCANEMEFCVAMSSFPPYIIPPPH
jgi:hypothetical protein